MDKLAHLVYTVLSAMSEIEAPSVDTSHPAALPSERAEYTRGAGYTIGAVTRMTGVPEATLRVWERRYSFPRTSRTRGGHRLYSQDEVLQLQWVKYRLDEGMRVSRAIQALEHTHRAAAVAAALHEALPLREPPDAALAPMRSSLLDALLAYNSAQAATILSDSLARYPLARAVLDIVRRAMATIGDLWCDGEATVALEHFATNFLRQRLLNWIRESPAPFAVSPIALACAPDELHEGSLLMLALLLRQLHWPVVYLGQALPLPDPPAVVTSLQPAVIVLVAMSEDAALALADWPRWLSPPPEGEPPIIGYGGRAFSQDPALAQRVPGTFLGATLAEGYQRLHRVMLNLNALRP